MNRKERESILEEEMIILRNSGEIPEIALHGSLYYLEEDEEGPGLLIRDEELEALYDAALARAREIVLRDLDPQNRDLGIYRGPARSIANWQRLRNFCRRINREVPGFERTVSRALVTFLSRETRDVEEARRSSSVNCTRKQLLSFIAELGLDCRSLPAGWQSLCMEEEENLAA
jgi:hypothetical protein